VRLDVSGVLDPSVQLSLAERTRHVLILLWLEQRKYGILLKVALILYSQGSGVGQKMTLILLCKY
jgi:hypothetical protein